MEIKLNAQVDSLPPLAAGKSKPRAVSEPVDQVSLDQSQALDQRLQDEPAVRADKVANAKELVSSINYPPQETIKKIANLLAMNLDRTE